PRPSPPRPRPGGDVYDSDRTSVGQTSTSRSTTVVLPVADGADTTNNRPRDGDALLDILDLLAHALELRLGRNHELDRLAAFNLRPDGIDLAIHLLDEKIQLAATRLGPGGQLAPVVEVPAHPHDLLVHVRSRDEPK